MSNWLHNVIYIMLKFDIIFIKCIENLIFDIIIAWKQGLVIWRSFMDRYVWGRLSVDVWGYCFAFSYFIFIELVIRDGKIWGHALNCGFIYNLFIFDKVFNSFLDEVKIDIGWMMFLNKFSYILICPDVFWCSLFPL